MKNVEAKRAAGRPRASKKPILQPPREAILLAAAALFAKQGFSATTTRQIAEKVGIRQPSLFYHFPRKQDIMLAIIEQSAATWQDYLDDLHRQSASAADKLYRLMCYDFEYLMNEPYQIGQLLILPEFRHGQFRASTQRVRDQILAAYRRLISQGKDDGMFVVADLHITTHTILGMGEALWSWYKPSPTRKPETIAHNIADLAMRGLLRRPATLASIKKRHAAFLQR